MKEIRLVNGFKIPPIGLGAQVIWEDETNNELFNKSYEIYSYAMESLKCKLYDTSESYGLNEEAMGEAIKDSGRRKDIIIISKVANSSQREKDGVRRALDRSLNRLKTDYLDVYLIHWPQTGTFIETWNELEKLYEEGLIKAIGVCNCNKHHFAAIKQSCKYMPMINEFEVHPLFTQDSLVNYCYAKDIQVISYTPLARMHDVLMNSGPIRKLSEKYGVSKAQLVLRWHIQQGFIPIPRTLNKKHLDEMFDIFGFELSDKDIAWISSLNDNVRLRYNSDTCDFSVL